MFQGRVISIKEAIQSLANSHTVYLHLTLVEDKYAWNKVLSITGPHPVDWDDLPIETDRMWDVHLECGDIYTIPSEEGWSTIGSGLYLQD